MNNKRSKVIKLFPETSKQLIEPKSSELLDMFVEINTPFILCVDDDPAVTELVSEYLNNQGFGTLTAQSAEDAMDLLSEYHHGPPQNFLHKKHRPKKHQNFI